MDLKREWKVLAAMVLVFVVAFHLPVGAPRFDNALRESLLLVRSYAREHVLTCLIPAFFIAGAIAVFISGRAVLRYLGPRANKVLAYGVAAVSGSILAVCSCTVLPLFAGIYKRGAGLGPATAFLYSGPAINVLAIVLTARVLGPEIGLARAVGAVVFSVVIGLAMHLIFRREELVRAAGHTEGPDDDGGRPLWQNATYFALLVAILVFANWGAASDSGGLMRAVHQAKWWITSGLTALLGVVLVLWFGVRPVALAAVGVVVAATAWLTGGPLVPFAVGVVGLSFVLNLSGGDGRKWFESTWGFAKQILPLLLIGVVVAGLLLGRPGGEGIIPSEWVSRAVGGNSLGANVFAAIAGAFMYFATLTEVPILQGLIGNGMGKGPALALLLAGPALSLPNMLVIRSVMGTRKTLVYVALVVVMATVSGFLFGLISG
ncbi:MAG: hypothetical protein GF405_00755 [Candidatus Eisenbacteria bacterium]|nr:hypothetical protein [Candidatus Eisenbacteria bacterium]